MCARWLTRMWRDSHTCSRARAVRSGRSLGRSGVNCQKLKTLNRPRVVFQNTGRLRLSRTFICLAVSNAFPDPFFLGVHEKLVDFLLAIFRGRTHGRRSRRTGRLRRARRPGRARASPTHVRTAQVRDGEFQKPIPLWRRAAHPPKLQHFAKKIHFVANDCSPH